MIRLHVIPAQGAPFDKEIEGVSMVIGRSDGVADLVLEDRFLSRRHAQLFVEEGCLMVKDLGSLNGTSAGIQYQYIQRRAAECSKRIG